LAVIAALYVGFFFLFQTILYVDVNSPARQIYNSLTANEETFNREEKPNSYVPSFKDFYHIACDDFNNSNIPFS
jgi:hypothetical protein